MSSITKEQFNHLTRKEQLIYICNSFQQLKEEQFKKRKWGIYAWVETRNTRIKELNKILFS